MKQLVESSGTETALSIEERNLLSVAYKNVIGARRATWRSLSGEDGAHSNLVTIYKGIVEDELEKICKEVAFLLTTFLIPAAASSGEVDSQVFYLKMAGDYYRYLAEFRRTDGNPETARDFYQQALDIAEDPANEEVLPATHPIRLGLALNCSVCFYEILENPAKACELARTAFDTAIHKLDHLDDASYKDSTLIMQLLRDNLTLWTQDSTAAVPSETASPDPTEE